MAPLTEEDARTFIRHRRASPRFVALADRRQPARRSSKGPFHRLSIRFTHVSCDTTVARHPSDTGDKGMEGAKRCRESNWTSC